MSLIHLTTQRRGERQGATRLAKPTGRYVEHICPPSLGNMLLCALCTFTHPQGAPGDQGSPDRCTAGPLTPGRGTACYPVS